MFSLCRSSAWAVAHSLFILAAPAFANDGSILRVCADPNNLPFSNQAGEGFENRLAELLARDLGMRVEYVWFSERKNFIERSLNAALCDTIMGLPAAMGSVGLTQPYYRSSYVMISRRNNAPALSSLYDERLASLRIGMHVVDNDYAPPAQILARRGLSANLIAFSLYGKEAEPNPPARLVEAVSRGDVDVAIAWGPLAGYFAARDALNVTPVTPQSFGTVPFVYEIAVAVRQGEAELRKKLSDALSRRCAEIQKLLSEFKVPQVLEGKPPCAFAPSVYSFSR